MTPKFTTACYVRIDDEAKQKEVCEKLGQMGYRVFRAINNPFGDMIFTDLFFADGSYTNKPCYAIWKNHMVVKELRNTHIDCGENEALFLDLAGMREDTDANQFFKKGNYLYKADEQGNLTMPFIHYHSSFPTTRATATEIINYHKQKGE